MGTKSKLKFVSRGERETGISNELATLSESGSAPKNRLKDAGALHRLWTKLMNADWRRSHNRTILNDMLDGGPPEAESIMRRAGRSWEYNFNLLEADARMAAAVCTYDGLLESTDTLIHIDTKPEVLPPEDLADACDIVAEEHAKLIREQSNLFADWQILEHQFCGYGVGFAFFPDAETPWWEPGGWDDFKMPNRTKASEEKVTTLLWTKSYLANELWAFIKDPKNIVKGWNPDEVKKAIVKAAHGTDRKLAWYDQWTLLEERLRDNDIAYGLCDSEEIDAVHGLIREYDGSYSFYIGLIDNSAEDFLYKDLNRYKKATEAFVTFTLNAGKKTYHSIRGILWKMYAGVQANQRMWMALLNQTAVGMSTMLQAADGENLDDLAVTFMGTFSSVAPGVTIVDRKMPELGTQALPVIGAMTRVIDNATAQFQPVEAPAPTGDRAKPYQTKYEVQANQAHDNALSTNAVNQFFRKLDLLDNEQFRRIQALSATTKAYPQVADFYERCIERLKPLGIDAVEFIKKGIRRVTAVRPIGNGSPQMRQLQMDRLQQRLGALDETGRNLAIRDSIALDMGRHAADRYLPKQKRIAPDAQIAVLENAALNQDQIPVLPNQNHAVHAAIHVPKFLEVIKQLVATRELNPEADFTPLRPQVDYAGRLHDHSAEHVQAMAADPSRAADTKSYNAALEQGGNLLAGYARELQAQERHSVFDQGQPGSAPAQPGGDQAKFDAIAASDPRIALETELRQQQLQHAQETHQLDLQLASAKVAQVTEQTRLNQAESAARIQQQLAKNKVQVP